MSFPSHLWTADAFLGFALASNGSLACLTECLWCLLLPWAGRQAGPRVLRAMHLRYSAAHCHALSLAVTHTGTCPSASPRPPPSRDSLTPRSSHAATCFSSVLSGPWGCCRGSLYFRLALRPQPWQQPDGWRNGFLILLPLSTTIRFSPEHLC